MNYPSRRSSTDVTADVPGRSVPAIEVRDVWKAFGAVTVLRGVSLQVQPGEVAAILGRSGSGKSTLLRCINHLAPPDRGEVWIAGKRFGHGGGGILAFRRGMEVNRMRARMPMVFQRFNLFHHRTVLGNVTEGQIAVMGRSKAEAEARAVEALKKVGLGHKLRSYPMHLSGGEQQRVGIARALAMDPDIILFDEPTSSLDPELVGEVLDIIRQLATEKMTMMIVTHEMQFARLTANRVYFLSEGVVCEQGTPEQIFERPETPQLKSFIQAILR
jgi:ABC-type polar amino acid transport system ATPase subunit